VTVMKRRAQDQVEIIVLGCWAQYGFVSASGKVNRSYLPRTASMPLNMFKVYLGLSYATITFGWMLGGSLREARQHMGRETS